MTVKVYSTPTCPWCNVAKRYLKAKNIPYIDLDVSSDKEAALEMVKKSGQRGVPVLDVNGNIIVGFDRDELERLLSA